MVWQVLFVIGVAFNFLAVWGLRWPWCLKSAWVFYLAAALIWLMAPDAIGFHPLHVRVE